MFIINFIKKLFGFADLNKDGHVDMADVSIAATVVKEQVKEAAKDATAVVTKVEKRVAKVVAKAKKLAPKKVVKPVVVDTAEKATLKKRGPKPKAKQ